VAVQTVGGRRRRCSALSCLVPDACRSDEPRRFLCRTFGRRSLTSVSTASHGLIKTYCRQSASSLTCVDCFAKRTMRIADHITLSAMSSYGHCLPAEPHYLCFVFSLRLIIDDIYITVYILSFQFKRSNVLSHLTSVLKFISIRQRFA
jgi:hypothetical protein